MPASREQVAPFDAVVFAAGICSVVALNYVSKAVGDSMEKKLTAWQTVQMRLGFVAILLLAIVVIYFIFLIINHFKS